MKNNIKAIFFKTSLFLSLVLFLLPDLSKAQTVKGDGGGMCVSSFTNSVNDFIELAKSRDLQTLKKNGITWKALEKAFNELDPVPSELPLKTCNSEDGFDVTNTACSFPKKENRNLLLDCSEEKTSWLYKQSVPLRWQLGIHEISFRISGVDDRQGKFSRELVREMISLVPRQILLKDTIFGTTSPLHVLIIANQENYLSFEDGPTINPDLTWNREDYTTVCHWGFKFDVSRPNKIIAVTVPNPSSEEVVRENCEKFRHQKGVGTVYICDESNTCVTESSMPNDLMPIEFDISDAGHIYARWVNARYFEPEGEHILFLDTEYLPHRQIIRGWE